MTTEIGAHGSGDQNRSFPRILDVFQHKSTNRKPPRGCTYRLTNRTWQYIVLQPNGAGPSGAGQLRPPSVCWPRLILENINGKHAMELEKPRAYGMLALEYYQFAILPLDINLPPQLTISDGSCHNHVFRYDKGFCRDKHMFVTRKNRSCGSYR